MTDEDTINKILERKKTPLFAIAEIAADIDKIEAQHADRVADYNAAVDAALTAGWRRSELKEMGITRRVGGTGGNGRRRGRRRRSNPEPEPVNPPFSG